MTVMDFGCGMGLFTIAMARLVGENGRVIAVDLQQPMLEVLGKRAQKAGVLRCVTLRHCEADSIGVSDSIDFALAFFSVHEVPDQRHLLAEIRDCLRDGGRLLIAEPIVHVPATAFQRTVSLAKEVGFTEKDRPGVRFSRAVLLSM